MNNKPIFNLMLAVLLVFVTYMFTYQVEYNEAVVVSTFGAADEGSVARGDDAESGLLGNLHLRWPYPIQRVREYDMRAQVLDTRLEEQQTKDKRSVIVSAYVTWRIDDPLAFYKNMKNMDAARERLGTRLRDARSVIGQYNFDELTNTDPDKLKLTQMEGQIRDQLRQEAETNGYGIEIMSVGVKRLILPQSVTIRVFDRMRKTRERMAQAALSSGQAQASKIESDANSATQLILGFANRRADAIRAEGDAAAAEFYPVFSQNEEFAVFLRKMKTYERVLQNNSTFFFDLKQGGLFEEFYNKPGAITGE
jgi:membrane protease subunit HflC